MRLAEAELPALDLDEWSGILLGGGPWNASDEPETKSVAQRRSERAIASLLDDVVERDFPFLGACYGIGTLGLHQGGVVDRSCPEPVGPLSVTLTSEGKADPVFAGVPDDFAAYGGHKESMLRLPEGAVQLATSAACPVQAFRVGQNVYATQFHPELDLTGVCTRIEVYKNAGYFDPGEADTLKALSRARGGPAPDDGAGELRAAARSLTVDVLEAGPLRAASINACRPESPRLTSRPNVGLSCGASRLPGPALTRSYRSGAARPGMRLPRLLHEVHPAIDEAQPSRSGRFPGQR